MPAVIEETVAPGFHLYHRSLHNWGEDMPEWTVTGCLPSEPFDNPWYDVSHYDLERALIAQGVLREEQCDSESGQFFVYPDSLEQCRAVGAWLKERLERDHTMTAAAMLA